MNAIGHKMILASAGSGKTYALTNRFVRLLALGAKPERIVALTFTRKAAGEFFDEILNKLAGAAVDQAKTQQLAHDIQLPRFGRSDFLGLLRAVVNVMHRLRLGTFDGFFARIARNFPIELGLTGEFEILQEHTSRRERGRVLRRMFQRAGGLTDAQKEFIEAFKRATFGAEEKQLGARLDRFLDEHQETFLTAPAGDRWGNPLQIWPTPSEWLSDLEPRKAREAAAAVRQWATAATMKDAPRQRWLDFVKEFEAWTAGVELVTPLKYVVEKALNAWPQLKTGRAVIEVLREKHELDERTCAALIAVVRYLVGVEITRQLEITRGIHAVLSGYESVYHDAVRRAGKLTFGDVQRLLMPDGSGARILSRVPAADGRLFIDYRLDAEIDHWLLDEFQDTSYGQWSVLKNLVDEAVQDASGARSFFYVGDIKQAIFAWREGDPRLFREIFEHYNSAQQGLIQEEHLLKSFRSGPPIIAAINQVFGDGAAISGLFPGEAAKQWNREWRPHESARAELDGQVALLHGADELERFQVALRIILEIQPLERGLSCAVLVQKNDTAARLADFLRREGGLPAIAESDLHVCTDNPLGVTLLSLVKAAAHPGDTLAQEHLRMTPMGEVLIKEGLESPEAVTTRILTEIHADGFERTVERWLKKLGSILEVEDEFSRLRAHQFTAAAGLFDTSGSRDCAEFVEFMERHTVREVDPSTVIRVMTIHKSKGLGFDVVVLPDLEGKKLDSRRDGLAVQRTSDRAVEWVLDLPGKLFLEQDEVLGAYLQTAEAAACYESLSLLYVAMTRAKRAMYLVTKTPGKSVSRNYPKLLAETLGEDDEPITIGELALSGACSLGDGTWHTRIPFQDLAAPVDAAPKTITGTKRRVPRRLPSRRPSEEQYGILPGSRLFAPSGGKLAIDLGRTVHELLAQVEWFTRSDFTRFERAWTGMGDAGEIALNCLRSAKLAPVWQELEGATVWRERTFEIVLNGAWVTGVFDRVVIEHDALGFPAKATVFDFKTDAEEASALGRYAQQLNLYRSAVAVLSGLPLVAVECELVFVRHLTRQKVPLARH